LQTLLHARSLLMTFVLALRTQYRRRNPLCRGIAFSVVMAIIALLIHSTVEFNLQIPANAATFMVILALGWVAAFLPRHNQKGWQPHHFLSKTLGGLLAESGKFDTEALAFFQKAAELRAVYGISWAHVALLKHRLNQHDADFFSALKKAKRAAPWNTYVQRLLMKTRLAAWYNLPQDMRLHLINDLEREIKRQPIRKLIRQSRRQWAVCSFRALPPGLKKFCG